MMRGPGPGGPHGPKGMPMKGRPGAKDPKKTLKRILSEVMKRYKFHYLLVLVCIVVSTLASVRGTLFTQALIDNYIIPLSAQENPDFGPLGRAMLAVAAMYILGAFAGCRITR